MKYKIGCNYKKCIPSSTEYTGKLIGIFEFNKNSTHFKNWALLETNEDTLYNGVRILAEYSKAVKGIDKYIISDKFYTWTALDIYPESLKQICVSNNKLTRKLFPHGYQSECGKKWCI